MKAFCEQCGGEYEKTRDWQRFCSNACKCKARYAATSPEDRREYERRYREQHREQINDYSRRFRKNNLEKVKAAKRVWEHDRRRRIGMSVRKHQAHVKAWERHIKAEHTKAKRSPYSGLSNSEAYRLRYLEDPEFRIKERLRRQLRKKAGIGRIEEAVRRAIHVKGKSFTIERLLGYSMAQLRTHLERQFKRGMSWESYGKTGWHIDHILPKKCFDLSSNEGIRAYWSLSNLRPLSARENLAKQAKVVTLL